MADSTYSSSAISPQDVEKRLNLGDLKYVPLLIGSQIVRRSTRIFKGVYDFTIQGGANGNINLYDQMLASLSKPAMNLNVATLSSKYQPLVLPPSFIVTRVLFDVLVTFTGAGTVAVSSGQTAADLKTATAFGSWTGLLDGIPVNTAATAVKILPATTAPGVTPYITIASGPLTAGKMNVHIEGYLSD